MTAKQSLVVAAVRVMSYSTSQLGIASPKESPDTHTRMPRFRSQGRNEEQGTHPSNNRANAHNEILNFYHNLT